MRGKVALCTERWRPRRTPVSAGRRCCAEVLPHGAVRHTVYLTINCVTCVTLFIATLCRQVAPTDCFTNHLWTIIAAFHALALRLYKFFSGADYLSEAASDVFSFLRLRAATGLSTQPSLRQKQRLAFLLFLAKTSKSRFDHLVTWQFDGRSLV